MDHQRAQRRVIHSRLRLVPRRLAHPVRLHSLRRLRFLFVLRRRPAPRQQRRHRRQRWPHPRRTPPLSWTSRRHHQSDQVRSRVAAPV